MAFKELNIPKRRLVLHPLMDMFFILMLFFLIIASVRNPNPNIGEGKPYRCVIPEQTGKATLLLQLYKDSVIWMDYRFMDKGADTISFLQIRPGFQRFADTVREVGGGEINIAIRCPAELAYENIDNIKHLLTSITDKINGINITFALLGGSADDIDFQNINGQRDSVFRPCTRQPANGPHRGISRFCAPLSGEGTGRNRSVCPWASRGPGAAH